MKKLGQIKTGAIISYLGLSINIMLTLIYTPWMVHKIGSADYGLYILANSLVGMLMLDFGLGAAVSRFVSKYRAENNKEAIRNLLGAVFKLYILIDVIILVVLSVVFFFLEGIYKNLTYEEIEKFKIIYIMVCGFNIVAFPFTPISGILNSYEKFIEMKLCELLNKILTVLLVVFVLYLNANVIYMVAVTILSNLLAIIYKSLVVYKNTDVSINFKIKDRSIHKEIFAFTLWTTIANIAQRLTFNTIPSVLGITSGSKQIALYSPASSIGAYYYSIAVAINGMFLPRISKMIADGNEKDIGKLMIKVGRYQVLLLGFILTGFICIGRDFMVLWMGPEFEKTYYCVIFILLADFFEYSQQIGLTTMIAKNLIKNQAIPAMFTTVVGLGLSFVFSHFAGAIGASLAFASSVTINVIILDFIFHKKLKINMFTFYAKCYLKAIVPFGVTILIFMLISVNISQVSWLWFGVKGIIFSIIFLILMFSFYFTKSERARVFSALKREH